MSWRWRNSGGTAAAGDSPCGGDGTGDAGVAAGTGSAATAGGGGLAGELSCAAGDVAGGAAASAGGSRGGSTRRGAGIAFPKGGGSIAALFSRGQGAGGVCPLKASRRPGDRGPRRQPAPAQPTPGPTGAG